MVVVGGGKSAIDNAVSAAKEGAEVTLVCRKLRQAIRAKRWSMVTSQRARTLQEVALACTAQAFEPRALQVRHLQPFRPLDVASPSPRATQLEIMSPLNMSVDHFLGPVWHLFWVRMERLKTFEHQNSGSDSF